MGIYRGPGGPGDATTDATAEGTIASTKASEAAASASAASASATSASGSATTATAQATIATTKATEASSSATSASTSATSATSSATSATSSATSATSSASTATTKASEASTSATNAATSASSASTSATTATTKASEAATSATNAATSETNAAASYDSFDDRYLGAKSSAPTVDNDGDALLTGALYWNSTSNSLFLWDGSAWNAAAFSASGAVTSFNTRTGAVTLSSGDVTTALGFTPSASGGLSNVVEDTTPQLGGDLDANGNDIDMGTNVITDTKVGQWDTAYTTTTGLGALATRATVGTAQIDDDAVTADKLANSINTEIAANTAKVTNATHTGDVTGATALTIANDAVTTAKINLVSVGTTPSIEAKGTSGDTSGFIQLNCEENTHGIKLKGPPHSAGADYTLTFPNNDGSSSEFLQTDGSGVLTWAVPTNTTYSAGAGITLGGTTFTLDLTKDQSWTGSQRSTPVADNDLSFDQDGANNFTCTPTGGGTLTFTNHTAGQSGYILLVNGSNYAITAHANTKITATDLATISVTGSYLLSYFDNGTNAYITVSASYG